MVLAGEVDDGSAGESGGDAGTPGGLDGGECEIGGECGGSLPLFAGGYQETEGGEGVVCDFLGAEVVEEEVPGEGGEVVDVGLQVAHGFACQCLELEDGVGDAE